MSSPLHSGESGLAARPNVLVRRYNQLVPRRVRRLIIRGTPAEARRRVKDWLVRADIGNRRNRRRTLRTRRPLLESDSSVREFVHGGRVLLGREATEFSIGAATARNLELVVAALDKAGVSYFLVPGMSSVRHVVGVAAEDREAVLAGLQEQYRGTALYGGIPRARGALSRLHFCADGPMPEEFAAARSLRFGEFLIGPADQLLSHTRFGCEIEFWSDGAKLLESGSPLLPKGCAPDVLENSLIAPRRNAVSGFIPSVEQVPARLTVRGRDYPTFLPFTLPLVNEVQFPIDVVYTWVDGGDPGLQAKRAKYQPEPAKANGHASKSSRFASHDELKYSLRSLEMYADFVRHIYVVTDDQVPEWLDVDAPGITVVDHKKIFSAPDALPVFNSHALSTQLHRIEGLSEHYLYFNDDILLGRPVAPQQFFHANGIANIPFSSAQFGLGEPHPLEAAPSSAGKNVRRLVWEEHKRFITNKFMHVPHPQLRAVMSELEELFPEDVERTARSRFRSVTDISMGASLHHHHALLTGRAVAGRYRLCYIDISTPEAERLLGRLSRSRGYDFICLNDVATADEDRERVSHLLNEFLEHYFPFPSSFERNA